jgi:plasmid stabilization system protein ParE
MDRFYRVILLPAAFADLDRITDYIKQDSPQNAAVVLDLLWQATQSLSQFPQRYKFHERRRDQALAVHSMPVPPFVVYYRIDEGSAVVRILTVRHGRRKQPKRFR